MKFLQMSLRSICYSQNIKEGVNQEQEKYFCKSMFKSRVGRNGMIRLLQDRFQAIFLLVSLLVYVKNLKFKPLQNKGNER
jgi:hypothetical protein